VVQVIETYAQDIVDTVREPLLILDATLRVRSANRAFYQTFHVSPAETEGRPIYELGNGQWDIPDLRRLLEDIVPASSVFNDFELAHDFPAIGRRLMLLNARKLRPGSHDELLVLAMEDVTDRRRAAEVVDRANARMAEANLRMSRDLKVAAKIQETFLPRVLPCVPGTAFAWVYRPCDELGGDGLNVIPLGAGRVGLYVLDVSGHGVASALLSVAMSRVLSPPSDPSSILVRDGGGPGDPVVTPPDEVADRLNRIFPFDPATEQFATLVYGILNARTGEFRYVSAGHPGPVHLPAGARPVVLASQGYPIGLAEDAYTERSVRLAVGDRLYLYSDGVPDATNPVGEPFGEARFLEGIGRVRSEPLQAGVAALLGEIERWRGAANALDDISILAVEVLAEPRAAADRAGTKRLPGR
jgi:serine phosphatase RsbU (regulator of sigma subunit)